MKNKFFYLFPLSFSLLFFILFSACDSNRIELIPYYEKIYLPVYDVEPQLTINQNNFSGLFEQVLTKELMYQQFGKGFHQFAYRFFINENGLIDKLIIINGFGDKLDGKVLKLLEQLKFTPAIIGDSTVKSQIGFLIFLSLNDSLKVQYPFRYSINTKKGRTNVMRILGAQQETSSLIYMNEYTLAADDIPRPVGGLRRLQKNIVYPDDSLNNETEGIVLVATFVNENGFVDVTRIVRGINHEIDLAAMQAVQITQFKPARYKGETVKAQLIIPVEFNIEQYQLD